MNQKWIKCYGCEKLFPYRDELETIRRDFREYIICSPECDDLIESRKPKYAPIWATEDF